MEDNSCKVQERILSITEGSEALDTINRLINCCWAIHGLLQIWARHPEKRRRVVNGLLALRYKDDPAFMAGSKEAAEKYVNCLADAEQLLSRYNTSEKQLEKWRQQAIHGQAPVFRGINRTDMAFAVLPYLESRLEWKLDHRPIAAAEKGSGKIELQSLFYSLLRGTWPQHFLFGWLADNRFKIITVSKGISVAEAEILEADQQQQTEEEQSTKGDYLCEACGSPDRLAKGEACRACGNQDTVLFPAASQQT
ncbi:MAG: hypothetical protein A2788_01590 [Candidatus Abawacabacteria bacterium RIFCSPHIGHO2_01_FULL_46_8]|uniref:Uncharacterized protein n=1 Tax=Candidatus Abawacabacteria bacterium RIFCSPHIGHO2_01_FULL_46_8 TaxID=1817815 RepID=A0A1F4XI72_9BACT|nr:MAG: hypothetical protein A2788_01590 [Candidatus Abawacabacteria bacterium RIFCSPHIGHO2_01_FULL_46_8]